MIFPVSRLITRKLPVSRYIWNSVIYCNTAINHLFWNCYGILIEVNLRLVSIWGFNVLLRTHWDYLHLYKFKLEVPLKYNNCLFRFAVNSYDNNLWCISRITQLTCIINIILSITVNFEIKPTKIPFSNPFTNF